MRAVEPKFAVEQPIPTWYTDGITFTAVAGEGNRRLDDPMPEEEDQP